MPEVEEEEEWGSVEDRKRERKVRKGNEQGTKVAVGVTDDLRGDVLTLVRLEHPREEVWVLLRLCIVVGPNQQRDESEKRGRGDARSRRPLRNLMLFASTC